MSLTEIASPIWQSEQKIPIRNLWVLMFYASDLFRVGFDSSVGSEHQPDMLPDLLAEILSYLVEKRLDRNLSRGYIPKKAIRPRVRGRIDILRTERLGLLFRGQVACRYHELTLNTPRNRFVRSALTHLAGLASTKDLRRRCRIVVSRLEQYGVLGAAPGRQEIGNQVFGRHDQQDRPMVAAARLALDLRIPADRAGEYILFQPHRDEHWLRRLFESAVAGFSRVNLEPHGWKVEVGKRHGWPITDQSPGALAVVPGMKTDIILEHREQRRRIIVDTKFASILRANGYGQARLKSAYLYQLYAYLRTQEDSDDTMSLNAEGLLLHPSTGFDLDEFMTVQGHKIRFATVDLSTNAPEFRERLAKTLTNSR